MHSIVKIALQCTKQLMTSILQPAKKHAPMAVTIQLNNPYGLFYTGAQGPS